MPVIRAHVKSFVDTWNVHGIRKQANRPTSVKGNPWFNWKHPTEGIRNYKCEVDPELLRVLQRDVAQLNADDYLPCDTLDWCHTQLTGEDLQFNPKLPPRKRNDERTTPHYTIYVELRRRAWSHYNSGALPIFSLCEKPRNAANWRPNVDN